MDGDFTSARWPGIAKMIEELGEVLQVLGKILGQPRPVDDEFTKPDHGWRGENLRALLEDEVGDALAAADFVMRLEKLDREKIEKRRAKKLAQFSLWAHNQTLRNR